MTIKLLRFFVIFILIFSCVLFAKPLRLFYICINETNKKQIKIKKIINMWTGAQVKQILDYYNEFNIKNKTITQSDEIEQIEFEQQQLNDAAISEAEQKNLELNKIKAIEQKKIAHIKAIEQKHLSVVLRQINNKFDCFVKELCLAVELKETGNPDSPHLIFINCDKSINNAEFATNCLAEFAHVWLNQYYTINTITKIETPFG